MARKNINIGTNANDGTGDPLRTAFDKTNDNFVELYEEISNIEGEQVTSSSLIRSKINETCDGTEGQVISFDATFVTNYVISIIDKNGKGIEVTAQDQNGFTITSLSSGTFDYIAIIENN